jgi:hypothetical protein
VAGSLTEHSNDEVAAEVQLRFAHVIDCERLLMPKLDDSVTALIGRCVVELAEA